MPDKVLPGPVHGNAPCVKEAVCVHTNRIYDSCRDKECIEDLRIYPTRASQEVLDRAINIKARHAELIDAEIKVSEVAFNRGFYTVDIRFFYRIVFDAYTCQNRPTPVCGLAVYDKRVILYGGEAGAKSFSSVSPENCTATASPKATLEAVDPMLLDLKLCDVCNCHITCDDICEIPSCVMSFFDDEIVIGGDCKRAFATLGQFTVIYLERLSSLIIPSYDNCMPNKEYASSSDDSPCELFRKINFPTEEFFPQSATKTCR